MRKLFLSLIAALALAAVAFPATALGAPPGNDDFANAVAIDPSALPFTDSQTIDEATMEDSSGEGVPCGYGSAQAQTVWYAITPTSDVVLRVSDSASFYYQFVAAYRQDESDLTGLANVACATWAYGTHTMSFTASAGQTYFIQAGSNFASSGTIGLTVEAVPPPANDDFGNAAPVGALPFSDQQDTSASTVEAGEPVPACGYGQSAGTVWYAFTPATSGSYSAVVPYGGFFWSQVAAYTGPGLGSLTPIGCRTFGQPLTFHADAGTTYYMQVGGLAGARGNVNFSIDVAPNPVAGFYYYPGDPSIYDSVQFSDQSYDPGQAGFGSEAWSFGDGNTASNPGCCPAHRYAVDGDYTAKLTVTTNDGRTASTSQVVHVRTHDVTITKFTTPQSAGVGQTRAVTVSLANHRYDDTVQVQLYKSVSGGGFAPVGSSQQLVPVRGGNRTTDFTFNYTFTPDDATLGKVTFQAVASIIGARDAISTDNTAISLPTKVNK